jgi:hypothetical protein
MRNRESKPRTARPIIRGTFLFLCLTAAGCKPSLPPAGTARFYLQNPGPEAFGPQLHAGKSAITLNFDYGGPRKILEWEPQVWKKGRPLPKSDFIREQILNPRESISFTIENSKIQGEWTHTVSCKLRYPNGESTGNHLVAMPERPFGWVVTVLPAADIELVENRRAVLWGLFFHPEKITLPPGSAMEDWAAKADAALLIRVRLTD